jgi:type III restriction enzyme
MADQFLYEKLNTLFEMTGTMPEVPEVISLNMPKQFELREYQEEALQYFIQGYENAQKKNRQVWNLFHMATGAGKTNMMAATILYLYDKGYRNFIFFVNAVNIVEKTKENFLNKEFKKYLFAQDIVINKQRVVVNAVENFVNVDDDAINIMFTTIQGLHDRLNTQKENSVSYADFEDKKIVLIADEAHHFSASTKKPSKKEQEEIAASEKTWEDTITRIYRMNKDNILLEFTATCDLKNKNIVEKYKGNPADIVFDYPLLKFRNSGYTKDLMNLRTNLNPMDRTLQALLLSQYRLKLFEKNGIVNSKPVVLLKAHKEIKNLDAFYDDFVDFMQNVLDEKAIDRIRNQATGFVQTMFDYFKNNGIDDRSLVAELKQAFSEEHIIKVHSKIPNVNDLQIQLNDLENNNNPCRLVMTLDMLHEGWDVLNLFDIVRLYDERQGGKSTAVKATIQEAQLIGRGARYFPFTLTDTDNKYKRKFDGQLNHEMRICETLLYHCVDDSKYITEIKAALKETGFDFTEEEHSFEYKVKPEFKSTKTYQEGKLFVNKQKKIGNDDVYAIPENISITVMRDLTSHSSVSALYDTTNNASSNNKVDGDKNTYKVLDLAKTNPNLVYKAMRQFPVFKFNILKEYFPHLMSHEEFITSKDYAGRYSFTIETNGEPTVVDVYEGLLELFDKLSSKISGIKERFEGTKDFVEVPLSNYVVDTTRKKSIPENDLEEKEGEGISQNASQVNKAYRIDLSKEDWFVYEDNFGTTEEKRFVAFFATKIKNLRKKYDEIYLIRNERNFHIYSFKDGGRFEPDYVLILGKNGMVLEQQQIFIEPKGTHLLETDSWKEEFLLALEKDANCICYHNKRDKFKVFGLPFYNHEERMQQFEDEFDRITGGNDDGET